MAKKELALTDKIVEIEGYNRINALKYTQIISDKCIRNSDGATFVEAGSEVTDFIYIEGESEFYYRGASNGSVAVCVYDENKAFIAVIEGTVNSFFTEFTRFEIPEGAVYMRVPNRKNYYQIDLGIQFVHRNEKQSEEIWGLSTSSSYNITLNKPLPSGQFYNSETAKANTPPYLRTKGKVIEYQIETYQWKREQFVGEGDSQWTNPQYWILQNIDPITKTALSVFNDWAARFDGVSSECIVDEIMIDSVGDYIEFELKCESPDPINGGYSFCGRTPGASTSIQVSLSEITVRGSDLTWLITNNIIKNIPTGKFRLKIEKVSGGIAVYIDDTLKHTGTVAGNISIKSFGHSYYNYGYWKGVIYSVKTCIDSVITEQSLFNFPGFLPQGIKAERESKFLDQLQAQSLLNGETALAVSNANKSILISEYDFISKFNGVSSYTSLDKTYKIDDEGDFVEIEVNITGSLHDGVYKALGIIGTELAGYNLFGYHYSNGWCVRDNAGNFIYFNYFDYGRAKYRLEVVGGQWQFSINGQVLSTKSKASYLLINNIANAYFTANYAGIDVYKLSINSQSDGSLENIEPYTLAGSVDVDLDYAKKTVPADFNQLANIYISYQKAGSASGKKLFYVYCKYPGSEFYVRFKLAHTTDLSEIYYRDIIEIEDGLLYQRSGESWISTGITVLAPGESESVFLPQGDYVDHCGGVHGDELMEWVKFYVNGVELTAAELSADFEIECDEFSYLQKSTLHETAKFTAVDTGLDATGGAGVLTISGGTYWIDGIDTTLPAWGQNTLTTVVDRTLSVTGGNTWQIDDYRLPNPAHPVWAIHYKNTTFGEAGYATKNKLEWQAAVENYWYVGIVCIATANADTVRNEEYEIAEVDRLGGHKLDATSLREVYFSHPTNGLSAFVTSKFVGDDTQDNNCAVFIWDTAQYNKYYRKTATQTPQIGDKWRGECQVKFSKK
ncbi:hypothetical protein [uncultured Sunxiuqinia sp.]|uniref:hypothetical protein n=1 Tax=uncultured Sunxiuqinia sp. TaxID=1573825 RepID=UPI002603773A|nr:hypothetical protein [uncultured Sunxiuqinia sp.]